MKTPRWETDHADIFNMIINFSVKVLQLYDYEQKQSVNMDNSNYVSPSTGNVLAQANGSFMMYNSKYSRKSKRNGHLSQWREYNTSGTR